MDTNDLKTIPKHEQLIWELTKYKLRTKNTATNHKMRIDLWSLQEAKTGKLSGLHHIIDMAGEWSINSTLP